MCGLEAYLKNSVEWELVREDVKGLSWNEVVTSPFPVSSLNEALLRVIRDKFLKQTIVGIMGDEPWFDEPCALAHRTYQRAYRVRTLNRR